MPTNQTVNFLILFVLAFEVFQHLILSVGFCLTLLFEVFQDLERDPV